ncbi:MAG: PIG-L family deacetylase [Acidimicrobiia bacterium]|nr:PIG-L family deacetylase [Acidimicrobiia bacterium]
MRILIVVAHPDDLDFGCAGSTAIWTDEGHDVVYCLVTDGQAGGVDESMSRDEMARIRRKEQTAAASVVGVTELHFLGFSDGRVEANLDLRKAISRTIRQTTPDRVVTQSPQRDLNRIYPSHPDHLAVGEATLCAVYPDARNPFAFPELLSDEGLRPHAVPEVWIMGGPQADTHVDITVTIDRKIEALLCHESQMQDPDGIGDRIREWARTSAEAAELPEGRLAERFRVVNTA